VGKIYKLTFEEVEPVKAVYAEDTLRSRISTAPRFWSEILENFQNSIEEITFSPKQDRLGVRSHTPGGGGTYVYVCVCVCFPFEPVRV
jgi:Rad9